MKKSHRKDVIIARIVFAVICVLLILIIAGIIVLLRGHLEEKKSTQQSQISDEGTQKQSGGGTHAADPIVTTEPAQVEEPHVIMRTTDDLRLRKEPNTDCEVITVLDKGTNLELLGEENGWAFVDVQGQTGYVSMDYLEELSGAQ